ncbi:c-type cytochrome, methanol metabolism-related [Ancylobacter sp. SL191]|jgi:methanol metabolism-related c-type cytochrome|uniref:c-type cytochrome, methanol metabolism-related n=1 Tax=Ancylobacter sp. SL191 TaxID=2995166 RepID=UPI00226D82FC|nr:c-type cytochrome, methanol metabolism-related [Ancylobacter sp. SL191]WAC29618.1 c-type cytochrome, methanol metabolism-related [Ancylobacter sp. SL191]
MKNSVRGWLLSGALPASASLSALVLATTLVLGGPATAQEAAPAAPAAGATAPAPAKEKDDLGKYTTEDGTPTYNIQADGTMDWYTYSGYRRYHAECHVCHGPDGMGSSYAPALANSLKTMTYEQFMEIVVNGKQNVGVGTADQVMPAFGENKNVMCYMDDLYIYLKARADGALGRERPSKREDKTKAYTANENQCFGRPS